MSRGDKGVNRGEEQCGTPDARARRWWRVRRWSGGVWGGVGYLDSEETVRLLLLAQAVKKDGEIVVVVELLDVHLRRKGTTEVNRG